MKENPFIFDNGWKVEDFLYAEGKIIGFSEQGEERVKNNKHLEIPLIIPRDKKKTFMQYAKEIQKDSFKAYGLKSVSIPRTIHDIGEGAFEDNEIEYATFYGHLKTLNKLAFRGNPEMKLFLANPRTDIEDLEKVKELFTNIRNLDLSQLKVLKVLPDNIFSGMDLDVVILPPNLVEIGSNTFGFNRLKSVTLPKSLKIIGPCAFTRNELEFVILPDSVESVKTEAFSVNEITRIDFSKNLKSITCMAFANNKIEKLNIPDNIESIESKAFINNPIKELRLGNSVKKIGQEAFPETKKVEKALFNHAMKK